MRRAVWLILLLCAPQVPTARAWVDDPAIQTPAGIHVTDGSYVMNVGELRVNITNHGLIGSRFTEVSSLSHAPSAQWPSGTSNEYLWAAGLWIGGVVRSIPRVSTGQYEGEIRPLDAAVETIYESIAGRLVRPPGNPLARGLRLPDEDADDDRDGLYDEEILDGHDNDGDGLIDEDYGHIGTQMMVCTMYDNTPLSREMFPEHSPLNLKIVQTSIAFDSVQYRNFVALQYEITNIGAIWIDDLTVGFFADCDIGRRTDSNLAGDDLAGYYEGLVRATDNSFRFVRVAYMHDAAEQNPLPGYFGVMMTGDRFNIDSYHNFSGQSAFEAGGDPNTDQERYQLMTDGRRDRNAESDAINDYRFLVASGATGPLPPHTSAKVQIILAVGDGLDALLRTCADALAVERGRYFDLDGDYYTGLYGRETKLCYPEVPTGIDPIYSKYQDAWQTRCLPPNHHLRLIEPGDFVENEYGDWCIWVNTDNCDECNILAGEVCTAGNALWSSNWTCNQQTVPFPERFGCTGIIGREGHISWIPGNLPPPPPHFRTWSRDNSVHIYWDDRSEKAIDQVTEVGDFESYRVWRADDWNRPIGSTVETGPASDTWQMVAEFDLVNTYSADFEIVMGDTVYNTLDLGANTGLEIASYVPTCLGDPRFEGLAEAMNDVVLADTVAWTFRPPLRNEENRPVPGLEALLRWESYPAVLDTFFLVAERPWSPGIPAKRTTRFYEYVDTEVHNGFLYFYSVTATDHALDFSTGEPRVAGAGLRGSPGVSHTTATPGTDAQTAEQRGRRNADIYVYPNPATRQSLAEFQAYEPGPDDPMGVRVAFANLPRAHNTIRIYTLAGDLVRQLQHDGTDGYGQTTWNLMSRNGQEVSSGIYLYSVESDDEAFERFTGKFVVIR